MVLPESWLTLLQVPTLHEVEISEKNKRLMVITGHYPIRSSFYNYETNSWSELYPIGEFGGNVAMSSFLRLSNGKYIGFFHDDGRYIDNSRNNERFQLFKSNRADDVLIELARSQKEDMLWTENEFDQTTSDQSSSEWSERELIYESFVGAKSYGDKSKIYKVIYNPKENKWENPSVIVTHDKAYLAEAGACFSPNQRQLLIIMRDNTRLFNSFISISNDNGETWSKATETHVNLRGDRHVFKYANDGRLVCVFRDSNAHSETYGDWIAWVGTYEDVLKGKKGQYRIRLKKNHKDIDCGYSGLEILDNGDILAVSYGHWTENELPFILGVRCNLKDIDNLSMNEE